MNRQVSLTLNTYEVRFQEDNVSFYDGNTKDFIYLPIEVFYQMWNSEEMSNHMEDYHKRRQTQESVSE